MMFEANHKMFKEAEHQMLYDKGYIDGYRQAVYDLLTNDDDNEGECKAEASLLSKGVVENDISKRKGSSKQA